MPLQLVELDSKIFQTKSSPPPTPARQTFDTLVLHYNFQNDKKLRELHVTFTRAPNGQEHDLSDQKVSFFLKSRNKGHVGNIPTTATEARTLTCVITRSVTKSISREHPSWLKYLLGMYILVYV